jgi:hypothetical protein
MAAKYEIATAADSPALVSADVVPRPGGPDRILFTQVMPVARLPPGEYVLRAVVTSSGEPLKTLTRRFEIAPPAVLMTSAAGAAPAPAASSELFLPVEESALIRPFGREDALRPQVVEDFLKRVPISTRATFEQGIALCEEDKLYPSWLVRAESCVKHAQLQDALAAADAALTLRPGEADALLVRIRALRGLGRDREADSALDRLYEVDAARADAFLLSGE